jgi:hypothetical protein
MTYKSGLGSQQGQEYLFLLQSARTVLAFDVSRPLVTVERFSVISVTSK